MFSQNTFSLQQFLQLILYPETMLKSTSPLRKSSDLLFLSISNNKINLSNQYSKRSSLNLLSDINKLTHSRVTETKFDFVKDDCISQVSQFPQKMLQSQVGQEINTCSNCQFWEEWANTQQEALLRMESQIIDREMQLAQQFSKISKENQEYKQKIAEMEKIIENQRDKFQSIQIKINQIASQRKSNEKMINDTPNKSSSFLLGDNLNNKNTAKINKENEKIRKCSENTATNYQTNLSNNEDCLDFQETHTQFEKKNIEALQKAQIQVKQIKKYEIQLEKYKFQNINLKQYNEVLLERLRASKFKVKN